jgi:hypothetical protein
MRILVVAVLAAALVNSAAFAGEQNTPLAAGKPAGVKVAQLDITNTTVIATTAVILVTALVLGITQKGYATPTTATTATGQ